MPNAGRMSKELKHGVTGDGHGQKDQSQADDLHRFLAV